MILRITDAKVVGPHRLAVTFNNGLDGTADLRPILEGPVFQQLRDPMQFAQVRLDAECGTIVWPNGADLAPEAVYELIDGTEASG
jgi:hypothetical protein